MNETPSEQWNEALKAVLKKATSDADFRTRCQSDPAAAIKEVTGLEISPEASVRFADGMKEVVIAPPPAGAKAGKLTDEQLEAIFGGSHGMPGTGIMFGPYFDDAVERMRNSP